MSIPDMQLGTKTYRCKQCDEIACDVCRFGDMWNFDKNMWREDKDAVKRVNNGQIAVFKVSNNPDTWIKYMNEEEILDWFNEENADRLSHLAMLYAGTSLPNNDGIYTLIAGHELISKILSKVVKDIRDSIKETKHK